MIAYAIIFYQVVIIPYRFCFKARAFGSMKVYEALMDIFFMFDLVLNFATGYYKKGNVIMKRGPIIRHYLRTWFIFDLLATFPFNWIFPDAKVDYWPDDGFDEINSDDGRIFIAKAFGSYLGYTLDAVATASPIYDIDLPQILRLLKMLRFPRLLKVTKIFKLRKLIYRVSNLYWL
jgi:hypothetical protein